MSNPVAAPTRMKAAYVRREHGVHGAIAVEPLGGDVSRFTAGLQLFVENHDSPYTVVAAKAGANHEVVLQLEGVSTKSDAQALRGAYLCVDQQQARTLGRDEWFEWQLIGLKVVDPTGVEIGVVKGLESTPAHDLLVLDTAKGEQLVPLVAAHVESVDVENGLVTIIPWQWVEG